MKFCLASNFLRCFDKTRTNIYEFWSADIEFNIVFEFIEPQKSQYTKHFEKNILTAFDKT